MANEKQQPINKPLSMQRREFINELENLINSGLDFYIVEPILSDALASVQQSLARREAVEQAAYNKQNIEQKGG